MDIPHVQVVEIEILNNSSNLRAVANIEYGHTTIFGVRVIHVPGKDPFVTPPQREIWQDGQRTWAPQVTWDRSLTNAISVAVLKAYAKELQPPRVKAPLPACFVILDLAPPCTADDIKRAYKQKVRVTHPDAGGDTRSFIAVHEAYNEALRLVGGAL